MLKQNVLPIKILPQPDELLSSWLVRLAIAHGQKLHTFTCLLWNKPGIWARDIDKSVTEEQVQILADRCGISFENARATTLVTYGGWVYETHNSLGANPWLTAIGVYHRTRIKYGQQFCPQCLSEDKQPYFRRCWRLAFITICTKHEKPLLDCCPKCSLPVNFHRDDLGNYHSFAPSFLTRCFSCQFDLRKCRSTAAPIVKPEIEFQARLAETVETGFWELAPERPIHSLAFFTGLRQIVKVLAINDKRVRELWAEFNLTFKQNNLNANNKRKIVDFPELRINDRRTLLNLAGYLLDNWSTHFVEISKKHRIWSSLWLKHLEEKRDGIFKPAPFWLWEAVSQHLIHRKYQPTNTEITAAIRYLRATDQSIVARRICRLLGNYSQKLKKLVLH